MAHNFNWSIFVGARAYVRLSHERQVMLECSTSQNDMLNEWIVHVNDTITHITTNHKNWVKVIKLHFNVARRGPASKFDWSDTQHTYAYSNIATRVMRVMQRDRRKISIIYHPKYVNKARRVCGLTRKQSGKCRWQFELQSIKHASSCNFTILAYLIWFCVSIHLVLHSEFVSFDDRQMSLICTWILLTAELNCKCNRMTKNVWWWLSPPSRFVSFRRSDE